MHELNEVDGLIISQKVEWAEVFTGFETKNKYAVLAPDGEQLYFATEEGGSFLGRIFLKSLRSFEIYIRDQEGNIVFYVRRPFRFFWHRLEIYDANDYLLGTVERQWAWVRRIYKVFDAKDREMAEIFGPFWRPWTFEVHMDGRKAGVISKKWSGLFKEIGSDADNFAIKFPRDIPEEEKAVLLGAVFLIDFMYFEHH